MHMLCRHPVKNLPFEAAQHVGRTAFDWISELSLQSRQRVCIVGWMAFFKVSARAKEPGRYDVHNRPQIL
jgi:hypothetical protein